MIRSALLHGSSIWTSCDKENLGRVLKLQKRAARVISDADNQASGVKLFNRLQWFPFYEESKIAKCCVAYKRIEGEVPLYTENSLILNSQQQNRATRYSNTNFICPRFNRMTEGGRSFAVTTCQLWNSLKGISHPSAHVRQFDFLSDGKVFKVDICHKNPSPSTLRGV